MVKAKTRACIDRIFALFNCVIPKVACWYFCLAALRTNWLMDLSKGLLRVLIIRPVEPNDQYT